MDEISNWSRALWTGLGLMLVGPFLAGVGVLAAVGLAPVFQLEPLLPDGLPNAGIAAIFAFVWAAVPCAIAALVLVPIVVRNGTMGALWAAAAGVLGFFVATIFTEMPYREQMPVLAFLAAIVALGVRYALLAGGILKVESE
ncbi:MAG: hypothetical protein AAFV69_10735 [Pseudomonadota bacterium]